MAKEIATSVAQAKKNDPMVKVRIKRAIAFGGVSLRPIKDGNTLRPIEATIPLSVARAHGPAKVEILDPVPDSETK